MSIVRMDSHIERSCSVQTFWKMQRTRDTEFRKTEDGSWQRYVRHTNGMKSGNGKQKRKTTDMIPRTSDATPMLPPASRMFFGLRFKGATNPYSLKSITWY